MTDKLDGLLMALRSTIDLNPADDDIRDRLATSFEVLEDAARYLLAFELPHEIELAQEFKP